MTLGVGLAGCGGGATCESVGEAICARACACTSGPGCGIGDGSGSVTFEGESDCRAFMVGLGCVDSSESDIDWGSCEAALDTAECVEGPDDDRVLEMPGVCEEEGGSADGPDGGSPVDGSVDAGSTGSDGGAVEATVLDGNDVNWALMEGETLVGSSESSSRKMLVLRAEAGEDRYEFGEAYLIRRSSASSHSRLIVPVDGVGDEPQCFIRAELRFLSSAGNLLHEMSTYVHGSIGGSDQTATCLQPGERGYLATIDQMPYSDIAYVDVSMSSLEFGQNARGAATPIDYSSDSQGFFHATLQNETEVDVEVTTGYVVVFDDDDRPIGAHLFSLFDEPVPVAAESSESLLGDVARSLHGTGSRVWFATAFDTQDTAFGDVATGESVASSTTCPDERARVAEALHFERIERMRAVKASQHGNSAATGDR